MKVTVIMEKAKDGNYSCFVEDDLPGFGLSGFGKTAEAAKEDMLKAYQEMREIQAEEGKKAPVLDFTYKYDLQCQYTSGVANAGQKQYDKIRTAVGKISKELSAATF